jgi:hypothetical protein
MAEEKETYTKEEMQKIIAQTRQQDLMMAYGKQWFMESLAHTENLVRQGAFPQEAHQVGQICFQQFMGNTGAQPEKKDEEKKPEDE